ncbi:Uncharacterized protein PBTT_05108 [Plasmodiophora brassicae]
MRVAFLTVVLLATCAFQLAASTKPGPADSIPDPVNNNTKPNLLDNVKAVRGAIVDKVAYCLRTNKYCGEWMKNVQNETIATGVDVAGVAAALAAGVPLWKTAKAVARRMSKTPPPPPSPVPAPVAPVETAPNGVVAKYGKAVAGAVAAGVTAGLAINALTGRSSAGAKGSATTTTAKHDAHSGAATVTVPAVALAAILLVAQF